MVSDLDSALSAARTVVQTHPHLILLVLHGSRARGLSRQDSDWDFAFLGSSDFDPSLLYADLTVALGTDRVDLANLATAGGLIRYRVARDGIVVMESIPGAFGRFWFDAVSFWCDAAPVLRSPSVVSNSDRAGRRVGLLRGAQVGRSRWLCRRVRLNAAQIVDPQLARRLVGAAGFRNLVAHAYESIDLVRVHHAATHGPADLRAFLMGVRDRLRSPS